MSNTNGLSVYDRFRDVLWYRGDGIHCTVLLPEGKLVKAITMPYSHTIVPIYDSLAILFYDPIATGELIQIELQDS